MKRYVILAAVLVVLLAAFVTVILVNLRSQRPDVLIDRLLYGSTEKLEDTRMRLNLARGDVPGAMVAGLARSDVPSDRRVLLADLMFSQLSRANDPRLAEALRAAARDADPAVRRKVAHCVAVYELLQDELPALACDSDPETRRQAYLTLVSETSWEDSGGGMWRRISPADRRRVLDMAAQTAKTSPDPEMRLLGSSVLGQQIESLGVQAVQAAQRGEMDRAEKCLAEALELDPNNHQARLRLARFRLANSPRPEALAAARKHQALIEIPELPAAPAVDGDPTEACWQSAFRSGDFFVTTSRWAAQPARGKTRAYLGHRDGTLYVAVLGYEKDLATLARKHTGRDSDVWRDDCVELLFDPAITGQDTYQIVINANNAAFDQKSGDKSVNFRFEHKARIFPDRGYWACEFAMKGEALGSFHVRPGDLWAMNVFRGRIAASEHCAMWPTFGGALRSDLYPLVLFAPTPGRPTSATSPATSPASSPSTAAAR